MDAVFHSMISNMSEFAQTLLTPVHNSRTSANQTLNGSFELGSFIAFYTSLFANPVFFGSVGLSILGFVAYYCRRAYYTLSDAFWSQFVRSMEISSDNV